MSKVDRLISQAYNMDDPEWGSAMKELEAMARCWEKFLNLPHEATISHGASDITRDWMASWNLNPPRYDGFFKDPEEALDYLLDLEGQGLEEINCNDMFWWGTSDSEKVTDEVQLHQAIEDVRKAKDSKAATDYGDLLYVARKRNLRPQGIVMSRMPEKVKALFMELPYRDVDLCNPYNTEGEYKYAD